ncbi:MAG: antitoxin MazE family protein [Rhodospirillaceae bacterium]|nr:antitoxin MazE family protein [Rhodospirillaceae bacterium]
MVKNQSSAARVQKRRNALRAQGLRPVQIWVPDTRVDGFAEDCARQVAAAGASDRANPELLVFADAALDDFVRIGDWS